jgi:hypothetical protein
MKLGNLLVVVGVALAVLFLAVRAASVDRAQSAAARAALVADTAIASHDTTRTLVLRLASLGDSLRVVQRRAVQVDQQADALDRALGLERAARDSLATTIAGYRGVVRADTVRDTVVVSASGRKNEEGRGGGASPSDTVRRGTFDIRQAPYTVHAQVELPPPPAAGTMVLGVDLDTLRFEVRLGCGPPNAAGVRPAATTVTGPSWAAIQLDRVEQSPDVCAALGVAESRWAPFKRAFERVGVSIGYVAGVGAHSALLAGPGVIVGVKVWP